MGGDYIRLAGLCKKYRSPLFRGSFFSGESGEFIHVGWYRRNVGLFMRSERKGREMNDAIVMFSMDGLVVELGLLCSAVPASGQSISSRAKLADFF